MVSALHRFLAAGIFLLIAGLNCFAQSFRPVADVSAFKREFAAQSVKVRTITSDFRQEKELVALTEKIVSTGKFWFKRDNKVRISYEKPFIYLLVINGDRMVVKDDQNESKVNVKSNKLFQQVNQVMLGCIQGTILESADFTSAIYESGTHYRVELVPVARSLKQFFKTIVLIIDRKDYTVSTLEMNEQGGDRTLLLFNNKIVNQPVNDQVFAL